MFKSCDYCRHRKKRCVVAEGGARCSDCEHLDLPCEFSQRRPSLKRRQTSRHIAAQLAAERLQRSLSPVDDTFSAGRRRVQVDSLSGKINKTLLERQGRRDGAGDVDIDGDDDGLETAYARYVHDVQPFLPFVPDELFLDVGKGGLLSDCIARASALSLNRMHARPAGDPAVLNAACQQPLSLSDAAGLLLVIPCLPLDDATVERVLDTVAAQPHQYPELFAGAVSTQTWKQLVHRPSTRLLLPTGMLHAFAMSLDEHSFARHYLLLADLGARFQRQTALTDDRIRPSENRRAWATLEYECLLWQVRLPPHLLDLRDELPATPESLVIHQLSSLVLLSLYSYILDHPALGRSVALRPVPGVLYFMCALARSVFICPRPVLDRWDLIVDIRATTARILLRLWHQTHFENCRAILDMWTDVEPQHAALAAQIRSEIGTGPWTVDEIDGYSVFWTFRDLRTLTLELIVGEKKEQEQEQSHEQSHET